MIGIGMEGKFVNFIYETLINILIFVFYSGGRSPSPYKRRRFERSISRGRYDRSRSRSFSPRERKRDRTFFL